MDIIMSLLSFQILNLDTENIFSCSETFENSGIKLIEIWKAR